MKLYCTTKLRKLLGLKDADLTAGKDEAETVDAWFGNLIWIETRKCLHITHSQTRYTAFITDIKKAQLTDLKAFVSLHLLQHLAAEAIDTADTERLVGEKPLKLGKAQDRRVLGSMKEQGQAAANYVASAEGLAQTDRLALNRWLNRILLTKQGKYITPIEELWGFLELPGEPAPEARLPY